jgi:hypothetical protein
LKTRDEFAKLSKVERCLNIVAVQATLALKKNISAIVGQQWPQYIVSGAFGRKKQACLLLTEENSKMCSEN